MSPEDVERYTRALGSGAVDTSNGRHGVVMGLSGPYVMLRPPRGGLEWEATPECVELLGSGNGNGSGPESAR
jgi:hypothetical protein